MLTFFHHLGYLAAVTGGVLLVSACTRLLTGGWKLWSELLDGEGPRRTPQLVARASDPTLSMPGRTRLAADLRAWLRTSAVVAISVPCAASGILPASETWSSFQNGGRVSLESGGDERRTVQADAPTWSITLPGSGQSSPVVFGDVIYVTSATGKQKETYHVVAYKLADGEKLWQHDVPDPLPVLDEGYVSRAAPTPAADERGVICFFEGGVVIALTPQGTVRWQRDLAEEYGPVESRHGISASVEQSQDLAFIWVERSNEPYLLAVDKNSGETRWKVAGLGATSWASPRLVPVGDEQHLVLSAVGSLVGVNPRTGERLWTLEGLSGNSTPTPIPLGEGRMLIGATDGRGEASGGNNAATNGVVGIKKDPSGVWTAAYEWQATKATSSFGSPLAHRGVAYFVNRTGVVQALDLKSGEPLYTQRGPGSVWATPVGIDGSVLLFCKDGQIAALEAGPEFVVLGEPTEPPAAPAAPAPEPAPAETTPPVETPSGRPGRGGAPTAGRTLYGVAVGPDCVLVREGDRLHRLPLVRFVAP